MRLGVLSLATALLAASVSGKQNVRGLVEDQVPPVVCTFDHSKVATPSTAEVFISVADYVDGQASEATFLLQFLSEAPFAGAGLDGILGWCVDYERALPGDTVYQMDLYSSYDATLLPSGAVDVPSMLPVLTYLINTFKVGDIVQACEFTEIEFPDIQVAVWKIIDEEAAPQVVDEINGITYPHDTCIVDYIVSSSIPQTEYEPDCYDGDEKIAVVMVVDADDGTITNQVIIAEIPLQEIGCDCGDGGGFGDPHLKTWTGDRYDFHGMCDLVLVHNPGFDSGTGLDIHLRTSKTKQWTYISSAVLRIGQETFEVATEADGTVRHFLNKVEGVTLTGVTFGGYQITSSTNNNFQKEFVVDLGKDGFVVFKTFKQLVRVDVSATKHTAFANSLGLMGEYGTGKWLARDASTVIEDPIAFGQEWQVLADEPMLFHTVAGPQAPQKCVMPNKSSTNRRLSESSITLEEAQEACSRVENEEDRDMCVFDVLAMEDKGVAGAY